MKKIMIVDDKPDLIFSIKCGLENFPEELKNRIDKVLKKQ
jgi:hypothetical protein